MSPPTIYKKADKCGVQNSKFNKKLKIQTDKQMLEYYIRRLKDLWTKVIWENHQYRWCKWMQVNREERKVMLLNCD